MLNKILKSGTFQFVILNSLIIFFQIFLITFFYNQMLSEIPLWYTKNWGTGILTQKVNIILIPFISILIVIFTSLFARISEKLHQYYFDKIVFNLSTLGNLILTYSLMNVIKKTTFTNLFFLDFIGSELLNSFFVALVSSLFLTPIFINLFEKYGLITDPKKHHHPGMILKQPSARGGGLVFAISFALSTILFVKLSLLTIGIILAGIITAIIGILDDISNTTATKKYKFLGNPMFRLFILLPIPVIILMATGVMTYSINNPFGGVFDFNFLTLNIFGYILKPLPYIFTFIWILWVINLLSWSNGVDGQYSGIITVAGIVIALLSIRFSNITDFEINNSKMAIITAGAALGILPFTWNPSKIMWGFGATSAGIVLAALSILASTKISISILVLLVPFMDGLITVIRRILNKQNPLKGDRSHLHHLLMNRGWSVKQIAVFYWVSTAILGVIGLYSSDKDLPLLVLTLGGLISFIIVLLNLKFNQINR